MQKRPSGWYNVRVLALLQCRGQIIIDKILRQRKRKVFHRRRPQRGGQVGLRLPETVVFRRSGSLLVCIFIPTIIELTRSFQLPLLQKTVFIPQLSKNSFGRKAARPHEVVIHPHCRAIRDGNRTIPFHIQIWRSVKRAKDSPPRYAPDVAIVTSPFYRNAGQVHHRKMIIPVGTQIFSVKRTRQTRCEPMGHRTMTGWPNRKTPSSPSPKD